MSDTLVQTAVFTKKRREDAVARATRRGFSKFHLVDLHVRIAEITARAHAEAITLGDVADRDQASAYVVACMAFDATEFPDTVMEAIRQLDSIGDVGRVAMGDIAVLMHCFADFTHSRPEGHSMESWRNLLNDISVEMTIGLKDEDDAAQMRTRSLARIVQILPHLWS